MPFDTQQASLFTKFLNCLEDERVILIDHADVGLPLIDAAAAYAGRRSVAAELRRMMLCTILYARCLMSKVVVCDDVMHGENEKEEEEMS